MSRDRESIDEVLRKSINEGLNVNPLCRFAENTAQDSASSTPARSPAKEGD